MIIRKLFKFENAHIVRNCMSDRCKYSIHGHSYKVEVIIESNFLDNGHMVMDFGLLKGDIKRIIDNFDHAVLVNKKDDRKEIIETYNERYVFTDDEIENFGAYIILLSEKFLSKIKHFNVSIKCQNETYEIKNGGL